MKFNNKSTLPIVFFAGFTSFIYGTYCIKFSNQDGLIWILIGFILSLTFIILAVKEVVNSTNLKPSEKRMWVIGLVFAGTIVGLVYLFNRRQKVVDNNTISI